MASSGRKRKGILKSRGKEAAGILRRAKKAFHLVSTIDAISFEAGLNIPEELLRIAQKKKAKAWVLDVGCGTGEALDNLSKDPMLRGKVKLNGINIKREGKWSSIEGVHLYVCASHSLSRKFARNTFDFIYMHKVWPRLYLKKETLEEAHMVLRKGGRFLITYFDRESERLIDRKKFRILRLTENACYLEKK